MTNKAPSVGTKVTTGENIPTTREAPGNVSEGSLAAESARKGGAFASNPAQQHEQAPQKRSQQPQAHSSQSSGGGGTPDKTTSFNLENQQTARGTSTSTGTGQGHEQARKQPTTTTTTTTDTSKTAGGGLETHHHQPKAYGGPAPTYLAGQMHRDPAGPHGKNLTEGGFEGSGTERGPLPEPGSVQDPGRAAVRGLGVSAVAGPGRGSGTGGGKGLGAGKVEEGSWYSPLEGDEPA